MDRRRSSTFLLTAATTLALAATTAPAQAAKGLELAVQDDAIFLHHHYQNSDLVLDKAAEMGADRIRVNLQWANSMSSAQRSAKTKPASITWDFAALEKLHDDAKTRGMELQVSLTGPAPAWATSNKKVGNTKPNPTHYAAFAKAVAQAFDGRIDRYSIWNEPNWHNLLNPASSAASTYRSMFQKGAKAIRSVDPGADVLIGELMPGANSKKSTPALKFLRDVACVDKSYKVVKKSCTQLTADGFALHPYNFSRRPKAAKNKNADIVEMGSLSRLTTALDKLHKRRALRTSSGAKMPVYLTEFGYFTSGTNAQTEKTQAAWLKEAWNIALKNPRVKQLLQYQLVDPSFASVTWRTAVMEEDLTPRLAYTTLQSLAK